MVKRTQRRGFFVIAALLVSIVVALFVGAGLRLSDMSLKATNTSAKKAQLAAESGFRYVQSCQAADYAWSADRGLVVDTPDMVIREDNGNIVGILRTEGGGFAQFRVRFNFQDDSGADVDGFPDPSSLIIDSPYVSVQNLLGGSPRSVPRADGAAWSVTPASERPYEVPAGSTCVIVEGRAGPGLSGLSAASLNPTPTGKVSTRVIEGYLEAPAPPGGDSAAQSAGDMIFAVEGTETVSLTAKEDNNLSRLRSRSRIEVQGGGSPNLVSTQGETYTNDGSLAADPDSNVSTFIEDSSRDFLSLGWDEIKKATSSDPSMNAGTYVIWDDGSMHYYDMDYNTYASHIQVNPSDSGSTVSLPAGMALDTSDLRNPRLEISGNILVDASGSSTDELNIIPRKGAQEDPPDSTDSDSAAGAEVEMGLATHGLYGSLTGGTRYEATPNYNLANDFDFSPSGVATPFTVQMHGDHYHIRNNTQNAGSETLQTPADFVSLLSQPGMNAADQATVNTIFESIGGTAPSMEEFDLGAIEPELRPDDFVIDFVPPEGESAILTAQGTVRLGANVRGKGGSITSEGDIRIIGNGADLSASQENGLAIYAKGDVAVSSLMEVPAGSNNWEYKDVKFEGVVYSWSDIKAKLSNDAASVSRRGNFVMQGAMVAYGGDPTGLPGTNGEGNIEVDAQSVEMKYDPIYILQLYTPPPSGPLVQTFHTLY